MADPHTYARSPDVVARPPRQIGELADAACVQSILGFGANARANDLKGCAEIIA